MWDLFQEIRLNDLRSRQGDAEAATRNHTADLEAVMRHVRKLALVNQALYLRRSTTPPIRPFAQT